MAYHTTCVNKYIDKSQCHFVVIALYFEIVFTKFHWHVFDKRNSVLKNDCLENVQADISLRNSYFNKISCEVLETYL